MFITAATIVLVIIVGAAVGIVMATKRRYSGAEPANAATCVVNSSCYLQDKYFKDPVDGLDAATARSKLNIPSSVPDDKISYVINTVRTAGYNPALALATWKKESSFGTDTGNKSDSNGRFEFGYDLDGWGGINKQVEGYIKTVNDAYNNQGSYGDRPSNVPIQVHWINTYTPASDTRNNVPEDRKILCSVLTPLVADQIVTDTSSTQISCGGGTIGNFTGGTDFRSIGPGFDGQVGLWKNIDEVFAALGGKNEANIENQIVAVKFMGIRLRINKAIVNQLKFVESDIQASGTTYKIRQGDSGAYVWRNNVNSPGLLSPHSTGLAIDINWESNGNGKRPGSCAARDAGCCPHDIPKAVSDAFEKNGFFWGAKFKGVCDAMHFQYGGNWN